MQEIHHDGNGRKQRQKRRLIMDEQHWSQTKNGKRLIEASFTAANLPEVEEKQLEAGVYTNQQIAEKCPTPVAFVLLLMQLPQGVGNASQRSILSLAVGML
jgi:hypothetical protein